MLKDKQAGAGLHKFGQHSGYNPVELSRWGAWLWGFNRAGQPSSRLGKTSRPESAKGVMRPGGFTGAGIPSRQGRSGPFERGSDAARPRLEAERFETSVIDVSKARP